MLDAAGSLLAIAILVVAGVLLARRGLLGDRTTEALKLLITRLTLPLLLFRAFLSVVPDGRTALLALVVFAGCAAMGVVGATLTRIARLPRPETRLLFQGFEAGMFGYALFVALHTTEPLPAFAALDLGQVVFVFTALMVQMSVLGRADGAGPAGFPWRDVVASPVLWAIFSGLALAIVAPDVALDIARTDGPAAPVFDTVGGLTTPLVCLVIGASLAGGIPRDRAIVTLVALRAVVGLALGLVVAFALVPALGFSEWYSRAAVVLFVLPPPFVIPVYYRRNPALVGGALTLSTLVSVALIAALTVLGVA